MIRPIVPPSKLSETTGEFYLGTGELRLVDSVSSPIVEFAPAKINLALAVTGRRLDGYHLIDTLTVFADAADRIEVSAGDSALGGDFWLETSGPFSPALPDPTANLVYTAAMALRSSALTADTGLPGTKLPDSRVLGARLKLDKRLPVASGIGAGSADAAATLRALNLLWGLERDTEQLAELGLSLGADVPMCLVGRPLRARGIGEVIAPLPLFPQLELVLVNPGVEVSTAEVFKGLSGGFSPALPDPGRLSGLGAVRDYLAETSNDLEVPACRAVPEIGATLDSLRSDPDCLLARMSGSGATCFGLFGDAGMAQNAARRIATERSNWWVLATSTGGCGGSVL